MATRSDFFTTDIFFGRASIAIISTVIEKLRYACGQNHDLTTATTWFLSLSDRWNTFPVVVLLHRDRIPFGALLIHGTKYGGVPIGIFRGGYLCGRGGVIGETEFYPTIIEYGTKALIDSKRAHTVIITSLLVGDGCPIFSLQRHQTDLSTNWQFHETRSRLPLTGGMDGLLSRFSQKMRKNFRYYKKRAEADYGCVFHPSLSSIQAMAAVERLHGVSARSVQLEAALQRQKAIEKQPRWFSMGLIDNSGAWVSYISGWRQGNSSVIEWQINQEDLHNASISMVMRHFFLEHEIATGMEEVIFLAGTTPIWGRVCESQICGEYLAMPEGRLGKLIRSVYRLLHPNGKVSQMTKGVGRPVKQ